MRHFNKDYVVDEYGRLFSLKSGELKELKPYVNHNGRLMYRITMEGKTKQYSAHHLSYVKCSEPTAGKLCLACYNAEKSSNIPSRETLEKELKTGKPIVYLSSLHGVSDNAYRKWLKKRGLPYRYNEIKIFMGV